MSWEGVERRKISCRERWESEAGKISFTIRAMSDVPPSHKNLRQQKMLADHQEDLWHPLPSDCWKICWKWIWLKWNDPCWAAEHRMEAEGWSSCSGPPLRRVYSVKRTSHPVMEGHATEDVSSTQLSQSFTPTKNHLQLPTASQIR